MKLKEVLNADFRDKKQKRIVIEKFRSIPYVNENLKNIKDGSEVIKCCEVVLDQAKFNHGVVFYHITNQTCILFDRKSKHDFTTYSRSMKELFIKMATYAYYYRKKKEEQ